MSTTLHDEQGERTDRTERAQRPHRPERPQRAQPPAPALADLLGGRVLAWIGGVATLLGIVLFLALAVSRGWIGVTARVLLAGAASSALLAAGVWLHARRGRTEASVVTVGVATAGLFATLLVAGSVYDLVAPLTAVAGAVLVGAVATALAVRWGRRAPAALGLLGAVVSPLAVGAPGDIATMAVLAIGCAAAVLTAARRGWSWLALAAIVAADGQFGAWALHDTWFGSALPVRDFVAINWMAALGLVGAIGLQAAAATPDDRQRTAAAKLPAPGAAAVLVLNTAVVGVTGVVAQSAMGEHAPSPWLAALAAAYAVTALAAARRRPSLRPLSALILALAVVLADVAFGTAVSGLAMGLGWGAAALLLGWLARRPALRESERTLAALGMGGHVAVTLIRALVLAPPSALSAGGVVHALALATLAATCLASACLIDRRWRPWVAALQIVALAAIAYLTAQQLTGAVLAGAWAAEALALGAIAGRGDGERPDLVAGGGGAAFLGLAVLHAVIVEAPPVALVAGARDLGAAAIALGAIAAALLGVARRRPAERPWLLGGAAATLLYLGSVAIITAFQPHNGAGVMLLDLGVRQQGQVLLSATLGVVGVITLLAGLRGDLAPVRNAALGLLLGTVAKVFLYDLSTLTSLYRVVSVVALGLLLLGSAFAYQRLRPAPLPGR